MVKVYNTINKYLTTSIIKIYIIVTFKIVYSYESTLIDQFSQSNSHKIYYFISSLTSCRSIPANISLDSNTFNCDSNGFNEYFYSVFTQSSVNQPSTADSPTDDYTTYLLNQHPP